MWDFPWKRRYVPDAPGFLKMFMDRVSEEYSYPTHSTIVIFDDGTCQATVTCNHLDETESYIRTEWCGEGDTIRDAINNLRESEPIHRTNERVAYTC